MSAEVPVEAQLNQMERVEPVGEAPPPEPVKEETPLNLEDEAAVEAALEANAIEVPDGDKLVASSDVGKVARAYRAELKGLRTKLADAEKGSSEAAQLKDQLAQLQQQVQQLTPYVQAYQQLQQQAQPQEPKQPEISDEEADNYARLYDLYKADGSGQLDRDRGRRIIGDMRRMARDAADQAAEAKVAPIHQMSVQQLSKTNLQRALATALPNGARASEAALKQVWAQLDPSVTASVEGAREAFLAAVGRTYAMSTAEELAKLVNSPVQSQEPAQRGPDGRYLPKTTTQIAADPLPRETAGGQDAPGRTQLGEKDKRWLEAIGVSEDDFHKQVEERTRRR